MHSYLAPCQQIIREAGRFLLENIQRNRLVNRKSSAFDLVTEVDEATQQIITGRIREQFPDHGIIAEEQDTYQPTDTLTWYIDPIDGTTNYWHRVPFFSISMALCAGDVPQLGLVHTPALNELFWTVRGGGAFNQDGALHVSQVDRIDQALIVTGFPYERTPGSDNNLTEFSRVVPHVQAIRRTGSAALDLCYIAAGRFDGYWEFYLKPWDSLAGQLLVTEAGGQVSTIREGQPMHGPGGLLATNGHIHEPLRRLVLGG